jgi:hypothetical protein
MNIFIRICAFTLLCFIGTLTPFPFFLFCAFLYVFFWSGVELFIITVCIDSIFGTTATSFLYTLSLGVILFSGHLLRPYLSWYTTKT